ncbi:MAG TPA: hypothetical protein VGS41_05795 [Chthonomonadales bacterium]|nr:hypothetical protein [Chthonomonadales bacterium]
MSSAMPQGPSGRAPVRRSAGSNCLAAGLVGCGALILIVAIVAVVATINLGKKSSGFGGIVRNAMSTEGCLRKLVTVRNAMEIYKKDHASRYPPKLQDLVPGYLSDASAWSCGSAAPQYHVPKPAEAPGTPVLTIQTGQTSVMMVTIDTYARLLKNGELVQVQVQTTPFSGG